MTERPCPRCHSLLTHPGDSTLVYCWHCGAPQILLSEELKTQADQIGEPGAISASNPPPPPDPYAVNWKSIILAAAAAAVVFTFVALTLAPLALLMPPIVLALYASRNRQSRITTALGARAGLLCGLFTSFGVALLATGTLAVLRATHQAARFNSLIDAVLQRFKEQSTAQSGAAAASFVNPFFTVPEFRIGFCLTEFVVFACIMLVGMAASGAFTGFLRSRTRTP